VGKNRDAELAETVAGTVLVVLPHGGHISDCLAQQASVKAGGHNQRWPDVCTALEDVTGGKIGAHASASADSNQLDTAADADNLNAVHYQ